MLYTIPNPNYTLPKPYPPPYFGYSDWESITLCKYQHYPAWIPTYPYPSMVILYPSTFPTLPTVGKIPSLQWVSTPPTPSTTPQPTYLTLPFITYPNLHFPTLYYCQGLIKYKAETTFQIRPNRPRTETTQAETTQTETTQDRVAIVEQERTWLCGHSKTVRIALCIVLFWPS